MDKYLPTMRPEPHHGLGAQRLHFIPFASFSLPFPSSEARRRIRSLTGRIYRVIELARARRPGVGD
jgi:hypothetical protein